MKKNKLWAICNLVMTMLIVLSVVFALTYEVNAYKEYTEKMKAQGDDWAGLAVLGLVASVIYAGIFFIVSLVLLMISWIGLFSSNRTGFLIVGSIGKFISLGGFFFLLIGSISLVSKALYIVLVLAYLAGAVLDIVFRKKLKE